MKKQRWRYTKFNEFYLCIGCNGKLNLNDPYQRKFRLHDVQCGYKAYGFI